MAAEKGRDFILKVGDGTSSESFTTIGGAKLVGFAFAGENVDIMDKDDDGWQTLLADAGKKSVTLNIQGVFKDSASEVTVRAMAIAQSIDNYEIHFATGDNFSGAFKWSGIDYSGAEVGELQYSGSLASSGVIAFTAAL